MTDRYPALSRLRNERLRSVSTPPQAPAEPGLLASIVSGAAQKVRHEWEWRSARFLAGFVFFLCSVLLFLASLAFGLGTLYTGLQILTNSQIVSLALMFAVCAGLGFFFMGRGLRKMGESVDFDNRPAPEITD